MLCEMVEASTELYSMLEDSMQHFVLYDRTNFVLHELVKSFIFVI